MAGKEKNPIEYAYKLLSGKDYTEYEIQQKMSLKGFNDKEIESAVLYLIEKKLVNDAVYAKKVIEKYTVQSPAGRGFIRQKLEEKGVKPRDYAFLLEERDEFQAARRAFGMKVKKPVTRENALKIKQKMNNYLISKGFDYDIIERVFNEEIKGGNDFEQQ